MVLRVFLLVHFSHKKWSDMEMGFYMSLLPSILYSLRVQYAERVQKTFPINFRNGNGKETFRCLVGVPLLDQVHTPLLEILRPQIVAPERLHTSIPRRGFKHHLERLYLSP